MYRLILVDDEQKIREGICNLFPWNQLGFEVCADFENGREALDYVRQTGSVDVVMTDIRMPVMDGIELAQELQNESVKVVFISSYQDFSYARSALKYQVYDYLLKPVKYNELADCLDRIRTALDVSRENTEQTDQAEGDSYYGNIISSVKQYVQENLSDASLEDAANRVSMSSAYLSRLFKQKTNMNFSDYLQQARMEKALELLNDPAYKQYQIAGLLGYDNPKNFTRAFKAYYQYTPQEYRKKEQGGEKEQKGNL